MITAQICDGIGNDIAGKGQQRECGQKPQKPFGSESAHPRKRVTK
jgi:hypothetical protein